LDVDGLMDAWVNARKDSCIFWIWAAIGFICLVINPWTASQSKDPAWVDVLAALVDEASDSASEMECVRLDATHFV
jgi:hypothetical protein